MFGISTATLIAYGIFALGALFTLGALKHGVDTHYAGIWQPKVAAEARRADLEANNAQTAIAANKSLQADIPKLKSTCDKAAADVKELEALANGQMNAAREAARRANEAIKQKDAELQRLRAAAATRTPGDPAQQCNTAKSTLMDLAREQRGGQ